MPVIATDENDIKERMSIGLVTLIAGRAGCEVSEVKVDRNSRDITISPVKGYQVNIDAQIKATINLIDAGIELKYDLDIKNYHDLRATEVGNAQILIVVDMHQLSSRWLRTSRRQTVFNNCAYWVSLYGLPDVGNRYKVRVSIPKNQMLTPEELAQIFERRYARIQGRHGGL